MMMGTEMVPETSVIFYQLAQLIAQEDFIKFSRCESFRSYILHNAGQSTIAAPCVQNINLSCNGLVQEDISHHVAQNYPIQNDAILSQQSGKLDVVMSLLQELNHTKEKVVLVSYFTQVE
jgi:hypothetical protein